MKEPDPHHRHRFAAKRDVLPTVEHRQSRYLNNRVENSHQPTRRRERQMQRFKSTSHAQRFLSAYGFIYGHFRSHRHRMTAGQHRAARAEAFRVWREETCARKSGLTAPAHYRRPQSFLTFAS